MVGEVFTQLIDLVLNSKLSNVHWTVERATYGKRSNLRIAFSEESLEF